MFTCTAIAHVLVGNFKVSFLVKNLNSSREENFATKLDHEGIETELKYQDGIEPGTYP